MEEWEKVREYKVENFWTVFNFWKDDENLLFMVSLGEGENKIVFYGEFKGGDFGVGKKMRSMRRTLSWLGELKKKLGLGCLDVKITGSGRIDLGEGSAERGLGDLRG